LTVVAGQTGYLHARLNRSLVTLNFTVVPVPFSDNYTIQISQTYETFVPLPVLVMTPPLQQFNDVSEGFQASYTVTVQNAGLIQMENCTITGAQDALASLQPLISYLPVVLPQQSVDIPLVVTYWGTNGPSTPGGHSLSSRPAKTGGSGPKDGDPPEPPQWMADCLPGGSVAELPEQIKAIRDHITATARAIGRCQEDDSEVPEDALHNLFLGAAAGAAETALEAPLAFATFVGCVIGRKLAYASGGAGYGPGGGGGGGPGGGPPQGSGEGFEAGGDGCLAPDTLVLMGDGRLKPISDLKPNDVVRSGERSDNLALVKELYSLMSTQVCQLTLAGSDARPHAGLTVTAEHLLWVDGKGWTAAGRVRQGDWLSDSHGGRVRVTDNEPLGRNLKVYSMRLALDNAFYANDVLVHDLCGLAAPVSARNLTEVPR
jgi:large repetitive protein